MVSDKGKLGNIPDDCNGPLQPQNLSRIYIFRANLLKAWLLWAMRYCNTSWVLWKRTVANIADCSQHFLKIISSENIKQAAFWFMYASPQMLVFFIIQQPHTLKFEIKY